MTDYKPEVLWECIVIDVFPEGLKRRVETIGADEPLDRYRDKSALHTMFVPIQRVVSLPPDTPAPPREV
jgi:hypothetical protein